MRCGTGGHQMNFMYQSKFLCIQRIKKVMVDLKIEQDEHIILRTKEAWSFDGDEERELQSLVLTNKHIISVYEKSVALIFKGKTVVDKKPLSLISTIDDVLQVKNIMDDNFGESLQVLFDNGMEELYFFGDAPKSEYQQWESAIKKAVIENDRTIIKNDEIPVAPLSSEENKQVVLVTMVEEKMNEKSDMPVFCISCGEKNNVGARFCQSCGTLLNAENKPKQTEESRKEEPYQQSTYSERKQEFAGKIIKCPNCGEVLSSFVALCPACGHELRDIESSNLIKNFSVKIEQMASDEQKATLIRNFPISNTKEDIFEFMILASSNIVGERNEEVFNAWLAKFEQCYQKAVLVFADSPDFTKLKNIYEQTTKQVSKEKTMHRINKTGTVVSKFTSTFPNPIFGIVFILLLIWEIIRIINGDFIGLDIIMVAIILRCVYKITNKNDKKKEE